MPVIMANEVALEYEERGQGDEYHALTADDLHHFMDAFGIRRASIVHSVRRN